MKKPNKFDYLFVLQGRYGYGWEDLCASDQDWEGIKLLRANEKEYQENEGGVYRIIRRREPNPEYLEQQQRKEPGKTIWEH